MGRSPCCSKEGLNRGAWTALEDKLLTAYVNANGEGGWRNLPQKAGLERCGKSCRLRWLNYLRPDIKRGNISSDEEELIVRLHKLLGNRWSLIAGRLPGRTDNEIKNYWNTRFGKKNVPQSSSQQSKKSPPGGKTRTRNHVNKPNNTLPIASAITNQPQPIRTKAFRCTKVVIQTPPNNSHYLNSNSNSNVNSTAFNSLENQVYQSPQDSSNSKMDIGIEGDDGTYDVYDPNFFNFNCHDLQTSSNNDEEMNYNLNTNSGNDSSQHLQFDDLILDEWITSNGLEENGYMDLDSSAFLLDCEKW